MLSGKALLEWARPRAQAAAKRDTGLGAPGEWDGITEAIAAAYIIGGTHALRDEMAQKQEKKDMTRDEAAMGPYLGKTPPRG